MVELLLPSVKMKSLSPRGVPFERELHEYLLTHFGGYTVASGSITGYWARKPDGEQCNEHLQYRIAVPSAKDRNRMERHVAHLAAELEEESIFCVAESKARLIFADKKKQ